MRLSGSFAMKASGYAIAMCLIASLANAQVIPQPGPAVPGGCAYNTTPPTLTNGQAGWVQCDATGRQVVVVSPGAPTALVATARGGAITTGGTSQTLMAANAARKAFTIQNPCTAAEQGIATAENLYINITSAATVSTNVNLAVLAPCAEYSMGFSGGGVSQAAITVIGATTAHIWYAKEFE